MACRVPAGFGDLDVLHGNQGVALIVIVSWPMKRLQSQQDASKMKLITLAVHG